MPNMKDEKNSAEIKKQVEFLQAKCKKTSWTFLIQIKK